MAIAAVAHLEALAQILDRRGLTTSVSHGFQHPLLAGRRTAVARLEEAPFIAIVGSWGGF